MKRKQLKLKWYSISLIVVMLMALLPPLTASAAPVLNITNLYVHTDPNAADAPADAFKDSSVQRFTTNGITLSVDINGIPVDQISNIYYEIENVTTGITTPNRSNRPIKNDNNDNQITFERVELTEGLNRIVVKFDSSSSIPSIPGWAYFTPVSNITNIMINDDVLTDGGMFPTTGPYTNVNIVGKANNAYQVSAILNGTSYGTSNFDDSTGTFTFLTNTGRVTDMSLRPGDNKIQFISKNPTNYYTTSRTFKYDNGLGFAYNGNIRFMGASTDIPLISEPTLTSNTKKDITFTADIKNSKGNIVAGVTDYVYAEVSVAGSASFTYMFADGSVSANGTLSDGTTAIAPSVSKTATTSKYDTYHMTVNLPLNLSSTSQQIDVKLVTASGALNTPTSYVFNYTNPDLPYLDRVSQSFSPSGGSFEVKLTEQGSNQINEFPATLYIYTNSITKSVNVNIPGFVDNGDFAVTETAPSSGIYRAAVTLHDLTDGPTTLTITPKDGTGTANNAGKKAFGLTISGAPYVIINNLYNGKVVKSREELVCGATGGPCITGKIVNLPAANYPLVELSVNDVNVPLTNTAVTPNKSLIDADGNFTISTTALTAAFNAATATAYSDLFKADGKKTIKFSLYLKSGSDKVLVTQSSYDVFVLSDYAPLIEKLLPDLSTTPYTDGNTSGTYLTTSNVLKLAGTLRNAELNTEAVLYLRNAPSGAVLTPPSLSMVGSKQEVSLDGKSYKIEFSSGAYTMDKYGDYVFEIVAKNGSGRTTSKMITITKQPVNYLLVQPSNFVKNADKIDQANVNTNSQVVVIQADGADKVVFGKVEATQTSSGMFRYEADGLKAGKNTISFEITRGTNKVKGSFILNNLNTPIEGAQYRTTISSKISAFNADIQLAFPKDTKLMRNDRTASEQFITADRKLLFGIANQDDGRVDKASETTAGMRFLLEPTGRFRPAGKLFWIDGGTVTATAASSNSTLKDALQGGGNLPSPASPGPGETSFYSRYIKDLMVPTQSGTLTLKYDSEIRLDSWKYITVYQYGTFLDPSGSGSQYVGWKNIGGVVDATKHTIKVPIESFGYFQVMYMDNSFNDVTAHDWARDYLDVLYSKGIMNNKTSGQFLPNDAITRGEFVTLLVKGFDIPLINEDSSYHTNDPTSPNFQGTFADVRRGLGLPNSSSLFDFMHIEAGARAGIVRGNSNGLFLPNNSITREDAAVMIARAANMKVSSDLTKTSASLKKQFTDADDSLMSSYAMPSIEAVVKAGYMDGVENTPVAGQKKSTYSFDPKGNMTRAQASAIIYRVMQKAGKLPK